MKAVAYYRVSTAGQGRSGLGLDAQRAAVEAVTVQRGMTLLAEFTEVESGKLNDRPQLAKALQHTRLTGSTLVIAKLDRLSRNAAFLLTLRESGVRFMAADFPDANDLTIGLLAVVAEAERQAISRRTREALAEIKVRIERDGAYHSLRSGRILTRLGNPNGWATQRGSTEKAVAAVKANAAARAEALADVLAALADEGVTSASAIARELNRRGFRTARNAAWHASTAAALKRKCFPETARGIENVDMPEQRLPEHRCADPWIVGGNE
jgi:DNA invertase Pin-like site-specific DNA recombinase